jgi:hypothetical protein
MCTLDKSHARLMTFLNTCEINSMLDYDTIDIGMLDITASTMKLHFDLFTLIPFVFSTCPPPPSSCKT